MVFLKNIHFILVLSVAFFLSACGKNEFKSLNETYNFSYDGYEKILKIENVNSAYALFFLAKDCGACDAQIPILNELSKEKNFKILAVLNGLYSKEEAKDIALSKHLELPLLYEIKASSFLSKAVDGIYGVPVVVFFNDEGFLDEKFIGLTPKNILENKIKLLQ